MTGSRLLLARPSGDETGVTSAATYPIEAIRVEARFRRELGDIKGLAESIRQVGLLHPVVITDSGLLVAGERRLAACRLLEMTEVPVTIVATVTDAVSQLHAERDENTCRKDMTVSEKVALGRALEALERPKAKQRQQEHGGTAPGKNTSVPGNRSVWTRDVVAAAVELGSGMSYWRAKTVIDAAEDDTASEHVRSIARDAREEMDLTGQIRPAYKKVKAAKAGLPVPESTDPPRTIRSRSVQDIVARIVRDARVGAELITKSYDLTNLTSSPEEWWKDVLRDLSIYGSFTAELRRRHKGEAQ